MHVGGCTQTELLDGDNCVNFKDVLMICKVPSFRSDHIRRLSSKTPTSKFPSMQFEACMTKCMHVCASQSICALQCSGHTGQYKQSIGTNGTSRYCLIQAGTNWQIAHEKLYPRTNRLHRSTPWYQIVQVNGNFLLGLRPFPSILRYLTAALQAQQGCEHHYGPSPCIQ